MTCARCGSELTEEEAEHEESLHEDDRLCGNCDDELSGGDIGEEENPALDEGHVSDCNYWIDEPCNCWVSKLEL
jgi:hypothetical protein